MIRNISMAVAAVVALAACGGEQSAAQEFGGLDVQVLGLETDVSGIDKVTVTLDGEIDYSIDLTKSGNVWAGSFANVLAGDYEAVATAFEGTTERFASIPKQVHILPGGPASLSFVLNAHVDNDADVPQFVSIHMDRTAVEQGGSVLFTVEAKANDLGYLAGKYSGSYSDDGSTFIADQWPPYSSPDFTIGDFTKVDASCTADCIWRAQTTWTATKAPGAQWFVLRAWNDESIAEMGVVVVVTDARVDADVDDIQFNLAPVVTFEPIRVLTSGGTTVYVALRATDAEGGLTYEFLGVGEASGCHGTLSKPVTGDLTSGAAFNATYTVAPTAAADCAITLVVKDAQGASTTRKIAFKNEGVGYGPAGRTVFTGFDVAVPANTAHEFTVSPALPADYVLPAGVDQILVRMALYNPAGVRVADFAKHADGYVQAADYDLGATDVEKYLWIDGAFAPNEFDGTMTWHFELQGQGAGTSRLVVEFIDADTGAVLAGDAAWVYVTN